MSSIRAETKGDPRVGRLQRHHRGPAGQPRRRGEARAGAVHPEGARRGATSIGRIIGASVQVQTHLRTTASARNTWWCRSAEVPGADAPGEGTFFLLMGARPEHYSAPAFSWAWHRRTPPAPALSCGRPPARPVRRGGAALGRCVLEAGGWVGRLPSSMVHVERRRGTYLNPQPPQ